MKKPIKVIIVEDNPEYRNVLQIAFRGHDTIELIGVYGSAEEALQPIESAPDDFIQPDIILLDLNLPEMSGLDAMKWFFKYMPDTPIIVLTQSDKESDVLTAIQNGAMGYLLKSSTLEKITESIQIVMEGGAHIDSKVAKYILDQLNPHAAKPAPVEETETEEASESNEDSKNSLSNREIEVLELLAQGMVKKEIAATLHISYFTVSAHIRHIYEKLNVINGPAAVSVSYQSGILPIKKKR